MRKSIHDVIINVVELNSNEYLSNWPRGTTDFYLLIVFKIQAGMYKAHIPPIVRALLFIPDFK